MLSARPRARPCWRGARARRTAAVAGLQVAGLQVAGGTEQPTRGSVTTNSRVRYNQLGGPIQPTRGSVTANLGVPYWVHLTSIHSRVRYSQLGGPLHPTRPFRAKNRSRTTELVATAGRVGRERL